MSSACMQERESIGGQRVWVGWGSAVVVFFQLCMCVCVDRLHQDVCGHRCQPGNKVSLAGETGIKFLQWNVIWILLPPGDQRVAGHQWTVSGWKPLCWISPQQPGLLFSTPLLWILRCLLGFPSVYVHMRAAAQMLTKHRCWDHAQEDFVWVCAFVHKLASAERGLGRWSRWAALLLNIQMHAHMCTHTGARWLVGPVCEGW